MVRLPIIVRTLGIAGLLPQVACFLLAVASPEWAGLALVAGFGYASLVFAFLGGVWWGLGLARLPVPGWWFAAAVLPALVALAAFLAWSAGLLDLVAALAIVGAGLVCSPFVDRRLARRASLPASWLGLRIRLSAGLGSLTLALAYLAFDLPL